jgi:hypothetical protein
MELTFNKTANGYTADYVATTHFNLHIEGGGIVQIQYKTSGNTYDNLKSFNTSTVDYDIVVNIAKGYRIRCSNLPTIAIITINK